MAYVAEYVEYYGEFGMRFTAATALKIVLQVCSAVQYLHGLGILHRDIKVQNLLFTESTFVKLSGFQFSRQKAEAMTRLGTPSHIAPEVYDTKLA